MPQVLIIDSGWGGLLITASVMTQLQNLNAGACVQYVNLAPSHEQGYNQMPRHVQVQTFENALNAVAARYQPTRILLACNSLAALLPHVQLQFNQKIIWSVVEEGTKHIFPRLQENSDALAVFFSTETTANEGIYPSMLESFGITEERVISIACQGLASCISAGDSTKIKAKIDEAMQLTKQKMTGFNQSTHGQVIYGLLACTHYAAVKPFFEEVAKKYFDSKMKILEIQYNLDDGLKGQYGELSVSLSGKYQINEVEKKTWKKLLTHPNALQHALDTMQVIEDLF